MRYSDGDEKQADEKQALNESEQVETVLMEGSVERVQVVE